MAVDTVAAGSGPTREGEFTVEQRGIQPVPDSSRYGRVFRLFTVWFAPQISPPPFFIGALAAAEFIGLGFWPAFFAIIVGNVVGTLPVAALATWGPQTGMAQMPLSRGAFGRGIVLPGIVNWAATVGWQAFNNVFGATAVHLLLHVPFWLALLFIFAGQALLSILGYEAVHTFEKWMTYVLGAVFLVLTLKILLFHGTIGGLTSSVHGADLVGSFLLMVVIVGSYVYGWAPYAADYSRYLPANSPKRHVFWYTFLGMAVGSAWMEVLGLAVAAKILALGTIGTAVAIRDFIGSGLGQIALIAIYLGTVAVNALNDYTGSLSLQSAGIRIRRPVAAFVTGVASFALSLWYLYGSSSLPDKAENFLLFIVYWISPWLGVVAVDWIRRRGRIDTGRLMSLKSLHSGAPAVIAFVVGFFASVPFSNTTAGFNFVTSHPGFAHYIGWFPYHGLHGADLGFLVGFVVAAVIYAVLDRRSSADDLYLPASTVAAVG